MMKTLQENLHKTLSRCLDLSEAENLEIKRVLTERGEGEQGQFVFCEYEITRAGWQWPCTGHAYGYLSRKGEFGFQSLGNVSPPV